jgi:signal transduction histidine kinase/CheY-like chemotaxis protein
LQHSGILIVDDDAITLHLCEQILKRAGYEVMCTSDPTSALQWLQEAQLDLLLTDIIMPQMDGFELIARAKAIQPDLAVLVMTGFGSIENAIEALRRGVDGLILKPFTEVEDLLNAVRQAVLQNQHKQDAGRLQALRPLFDVSERLISQTNPGSLLEQILTATVHLLQTGQIGIFEKTESQAGFTLLAERGSLPWKKLAGKEGGIRLLLNADKHPHSLQDSWTPESLKQMLKRFGLCSVMCVEVQREKRNLVIFAGRGLDEGDFIESDYERLAILAHQSAVALENAGLYEDLRLSLRRVEESQIALVQSEKMAAAGRLVLSVAHEINNPLQAVRNCLHLAVHDEVPEDQKRTYIELAEKELDRLENTVERMLDISRPGRADREWVDVHWLAERVLQFLNFQFKKQGIQVETAFNEGLPRVFVIREQLQQVILNILLNAIDALETSIGEKAIWISAFQENNHVKIHIEDSGSGIPDGVRDRIFEPFFSTKTKGTGLGLAISYELIESQNGKLTLVPGNHGSGACFEILIPIRGKYGRRTNSGS